MRIQHNIPAMNAYRNFNKNASGLNKNLEKLSSGYKINRAGDDAAGLAISEKMRAQITGLEVANKNAKDGISVVQTAEGALTEVHDMLNRMYNLAEQSANGTYKTSERTKLQAEINQLSSEIDRIADSTNFNGLKLLDGSLQKQSAGVQRVNLTGADRVLNAVIQDGEYANEVAGKKTIFDHFAKSAAKGQFSVDLADIKFKVNTGDSLKSTTTSGSFALAGFTLTIGDKTFRTVSGASKASAGGVVATIEGSKVTIKASNLAAAFKAVALNDYSGTGTVPTVTINGVTWKMSIGVGRNGSNSKLFFTMVSEPLDEKEARTNFDVRIDYNHEATVRGTMVNYNGKDQGKVRIIAEGGALLAGTKVEKEGVAAGTISNANTIIKLTKDDIRDGATMTLGLGTKAHTVVFKVGADSTTTIASSAKNSGKTHLIDLSYMKEDNIDLHAALNAISKTVATFGFTYSYRNKDTGKMQTATANFTLGVSDGTNSNEVGLAIRRSGDLSTSAPAYFTDLSKFDKIFSMDYEKNLKERNGLKLQIGDTADEWNQLEVSINDMHASALGVGNLDITSAEAAATAMDKIMSAIDLVSETRANLGAIQNRLDHTISNLSVTRENLQDAESTIRDTDVAEEMMTYTKNSILNQAAQAMLAQANQQPQGVLQLLG